MSPRPIINTGGRQQAPRLDVTSTAARTRSAGGRVSLERRSSRFAAAIARLDAGGLQATDLSALMDDIAAQYPMGSAQPLGFVATCHLGFPYEVHILDFIGGIVEHFELGKPMPHPFERARTLAGHPAYEVIEIYDQVLVCVRADGSVTEMRM
jgi:hypothetical protein